MSTSCNRRDLVKGRSGVFLWVLPWIAVVGTSFFGPTVEVLVWTPSFALMGVACLANAGGCGRLHCYLTGPLYLAGAAVTLFRSFGVVSPDSSWILGAMILGTVLAHVPEWVLGRYVTTSRA